MPRISRDERGIYNKTCKKDLASNNNNYYYVKCAHNVHYHDDHHHNSDDESREDPVTSPYSEGETNVNTSAAESPFENYHRDSFHIPKKSGSGDVPHKSPGNNACGA
jgi:hypothetical protein